MGSHKKYPKWIDQYAKVVYELVQTHDPNTHLPFNGFNFYPLFDDLWIDKIYQAIKKYEESKLNIEDITPFLPGHSSMKFNLLELIIDLKTSHAQPEKAKTIINFFMQVISQRAGQGDLFKDTRIKSFENINNVIATKKLIKASTDSAREVGRVIAGCASLAHGLYNDFCTDYGYDTFGPYPLPKEVGEKKTAALFIRQFIDLRPIEIWPQFKSFPYKKIIIYTIYRGVKSKSHYIGCHMIYKQSLVDNLTYFQVEVDDTFVNSLPELKKIREKILQVASQHYSQYKQLGFEQYKQIWLYQLCYQFKDFFEKLNLDWKPSQKMIDQVKGKKLKKYITTYDFNFEKFCNKFGINYLKRIYSA